MKLRAPDAADSPRSCPACPRRHSWAAGGRRAAPMVAVVGPGEEQQRWTVPVVGTTALDRCCRWVRRVNSSDVLFAVVAAGWQTAAVGGWWVNSLGWCGVGGSGGG